jgi:hypothetical protein
MRLTILCRLISFGGESLSRATTTYFNNQYDFLLFLLVDVTFKTFSIGLALDGLLFLTPVCGILFLLRLFSLHGDHVVIDPEEYES